MKKKSWNNDLSIGIELIDNQHMEWVKHYDAAVEAITSNQGAEQVVKTLNYLIDYTNIHFSTEEKNMLKYSYSDYAIHKEQHDRLNKTLQDLVNEYRDEGPTNILQDSVHTFLNNWLSTHIMKYDKKFIDFVKENDLQLIE